MINIILKMHSLHKLLMYNIMVAILTTELQKFKLGAINAFLLGVDGL